MSFYRIVPVKRRIIGSEGGSMNRKNVFVILGVLVALGVLSGYLVLRSQNSSQTTTTNNATVGGNTGSSNSATTGTSVTIQNFAFTPQTITVAKGTTVRWTNNDSAAHTVTETDGKTGPDSPSLEQGASYSFTYQQAGTYQYHCAFHASMTGTVVVTE